MTINPKTGLYEAGFLSSILPTLVGGAVSMYAGPWAGAAAGAAVGAATGSKKNGVLMNAGMGALGGYGGAGIAGSLAGTGAAAAGTAAAETVTAEALKRQAAEEALRQTMSTTAGLTEGAASAAGQGAFGGEIMGNAFGEQAVTSPAWARAQMLGQQGVDANMLAGTPTFNSSAGIGGGAEAAGQMTWDNVKRGAAQMWDGPWNAQTLGPYKTPAMAAGISAMGLGAMDGPTIDPQTGQLAKPEIKKYRYDQPNRPNNPATFTRMYAQGGGISGGQGAQLQPRMIKGPGTGLSDGVTAQLPGGQRAALADGEFVVSSDVVSALGGGSSDSGSKKLYAMMDRIRKQAHGTKKQVRKVNDKRVLPA